MPAGRIEELYAEVSVRLDKLERGLKDAERMSERGAKQIESKLQLGDMLAKGFAALGTIETAMRGVAAATALVKGDTEKFTQLVESLPLGLGGVARAAREVYEAFSGAAEEAARMRKEAERAAAVRTSREKLRGFKISGAAELEDLQKQLSRFSMSDVERAVFAVEEKMQTAMEEARKKAAEQRAEAVGAGGSQRRFWTSIGEIEIELRQKQQVIAKLANAEIEAIRKVEAERKAAAANERDDRRAAFRERMDEIVKESRRREEAARKEAERRAQAARQDALRLINLESDIEATKARLAGDEAKVKRIGIEAEFRNRFGMAESRTLREQAMIDQYKKLRLLEAAAEEKREAGRFDPRSFAAGGMGINVGALSIEKPTIKLSLEDRKLLEDIRRNTGKDKVARVAP